MLWYCFVRVLSMPAVAATATSTMSRMSNFRRQRTATESKKFGVAAEPVPSLGTSLFYRSPFENCLSRNGIQARRLDDATDTECRPPGSTRTDWTSWPSSCRGGGLGRRRWSADRSREQFGVRGALLASALPLVIAVVGRSTRGTLIGLAVWLIALGLIRRLIPSGTGGTVSDDPLLLVGPATLGALFIISAGRGAFRQRTALASSVLMLSVLALVEAFNPLQGGLLIGFGGLLFVLLPMLAFWVGRVLVNGKILRQILRVVAILAASGCRLWPGTAVCGVSLLGPSLDSLLRLFGLGRR